jgi:hypothetical protein
MSVETGVTVVCRHQDALLASTVTEAENPHRKSGIPTLKKAVSAAGGVVH